jgi:hypothetical protein
MSRSLVEFRHGTPELRAELYSPMATPIPNPRNGIQLSELHETPSPRQLRQVFPLQSNEMLFTIVCSRLRNDPYINRFRNVRSRVVFCSAERLVAGCDDERCSPVLNHVRSTFPPHPVQACFIQ